MNRLRIFGHYTNVRVAESGALPAFSLPLLALDAVLAAKEGPSADLLNRVAMPSEYSARIAIYDPFGFLLNPSGVSTLAQVASVCTAEQWHLLQRITGRLKLLVTACNHVQDTPDFGEAPAGRESSQDIVLPSITGLATEFQELLLVFAIIPPLRAGMAPGIALSAAFLNDDVLFAWDVS